MNENEKDIVELEEELDSSEISPDEEPSAIKSLYEWIELFVYSFSVVLIVITFIARPSPVKGESMLNTLHDGDILVVSNLFYEPKQGDIVVFQSASTGYDEPYVKRIIALEGQTIDINFDTWEVTVDGVVLDEYYVRTESRTMYGSSFDYPMTIPEGTAFVMGDNRNHSQDSRSAIVGCVETRFLLGRVIVRLFPFDKIGFVN